MSTVYNRRRGGKANKSRVKRTCQYVDCIAFAVGASKYCSDHKPYVATLPPSSPPLPFGALRGKWLGNLWFKGGE